MTNSMRVFLTGGDRGGWALDDDLAQVRTALSAIENIQFVDTINDAEIVHSVWPLALREIDSAALVGKRVITHLPTESAALARDPYFPFYRAATSMWIAQSSEALRTLPPLGIQDPKYVPYAINTQLFHRVVPISEQIIELRQRIVSLSREAVVIGSFQRDSEGSDLTRPKRVKGPDILLEIALGLRAQNIPIHFLLAGPRRHWLRNQFQYYGIPFTFFGEETTEDDYSINVLPRTMLAQLYRIVDLYIVASRSEGGPRAILEAAACGTPTVSSATGIAPDILPETGLFRSVPEAIERITALGFGDLPIHRLANEGSSGRVQAMQVQQIRNLATIAAARVAAAHTPARCTPLWRAIYAQAHSCRMISASSCLRLQHSKPKAEGAAQRLSPSVRRGVKSMLHSLGLTRTVSRWLRPSPSFHVSLVYEFKRPPYGGGNQFFLALRNALRAHGIRVSENRYANDVDVFLLNSTWFSPERFKEFATKRSPAVVHRIDGPTELVRGNGDQRPDQECFALNQEFATRTVMQSIWSYCATLRMGYAPKAPCIIPNATDPRLFFPKESSAPILTPGEKLRIVASSWSDNPRKGSEVLEWMDTHLDWSRYEMTFVGRVKSSFTNIRHLPAVGSAELGSVLRNHHLYFTASRNDPCSNALIEGLSCGLPALYFNDGGHPELVSWGGVGFIYPEEIPERLSSIVNHYATYARLVTPPSMEEVVSAYITVLQLAIEERSAR